MTRFISAIACLSLCAAAHAAPLLTGVVEDISGQTIEMPSLPGSWQRQIAWMAPEGSQVEVGDLVVRIEPGDLVAQEEQTRTDLEKTRLSAARRIDELKLILLDAETELARAESAVRLAEFDAVIPVTTIPKLDYERYQLTLETAQKALVRAQAEVLNRQAELRDVEAETALEINKAESLYERISDALGATEMHAEKAGFIIYGENPWTGRKVFPGETLYASFHIATVASREDLQLRFWVHEADFLDVRLGRRVQVTPDAQGLPPFDAEITWLSSQAEEKEDWGDGGYFEAYARPVGEVPPGIAPGMSVMGRVLDREAGP
jgi:multidrug efflux pump subunit AcrA (membrane-fusion protein)